ncbi:MAG TPA: MotA/TolQ/ExbB proton channel family protein [Gammaproteobacteria bacterium]|nr:MotA/TolQ/ExbB proton channel family protein [Gammaproteobacteria bacterium]
MELVKFFQTGGYFMYPILLVFALGLAIAIERFLYISRTLGRTRKLWTQLSPTLKAQDLAQAMQKTGKVKTPLATMLNYGFARKQANSTRSGIESAMEEGMMEIMPELEQRTHYLATFANIATLLGLLGTIIGLIQAFTAVAGADPADKADLLSASISVAMNTTAFGLIAAIPLILIHSYLNTKTARLIDTIEMAAVKCLNLIAND